MLQAGKSRVQFPTMSLDFSIYLILSASQLANKNGIKKKPSAQLLTEMTTRNLPG
jgi:hypothetical protein